MFNHFVIVLATLGAFAPNPADTAVAKVTKTGLEPEVADISGYYTCKGLETGGKTYSGVCVITKKNDVYLVQWMVGSGSTFTGIGIRQGNTLSASWALPNERGILRGVNVYRIEPGPRLVGRWATLPGGGNLQNETLTFLKSVEEDDE